MEPSKLSDGRHVQRVARRHAACGWCAGLVALGLACLTLPGVAADSLNGLGAAFRPQASAAAPAAVGGGDRSNSNVQGLRVIVSGTAGSVASIDGQTVHVGDIVNDMRVTQINLRGVVLKAED